METHFSLAAAGECESVVMMMKEYYAFDHLDFRPERARTALRRLLEDDSLGSVWVIRRGADAVGYFVLTYGYCLEFGGRITVLDEFYIRAGFRRLGIGRQALAFVENLCGKMGMCALRLEVECGNAAAQSLYTKNGFLRHDRYLMTNPL
jgi:ribosomal protein S18 acetylase RimI-like enzyme